MKRFHDLEGLNNEVGGAKTKVGGGRLASPHLILHVKSVAKL